KNLKAEATVATLAFTRIGEQNYEVLLTDGRGDRKTYILAGDLWQLDARILKWHGPLLALGIKPGFKLDRLQGRYISLEQERRNERTVYDLGTPDIGF